MFKNNLIPYVIEKSSDGERSYDIYSRLLQDRIIFLSGEVNTALVESIKAQLLFLNNADKEKPIYIYINSPGGSVIDGLGVIDVMNFITAPVYTFVVGMAASMGAAILSCGEQGHRYALPNSQIMLHEVSGGTQGKCHENTVNHNYERRLNNLLLAMIAYNCGKMSEESYLEIRNKVEELEDRDEDAHLELTEKAKNELAYIKKVTDIDNWMMPRKAKSFGIVDDILTKELN